MNQDPPAIALTRERFQAESTASMLRKAGTHVIVTPTIKYEQIQSKALLENHLKSLSEGDIIAFTSANAVKAYFQQIPRGFNLPRFNYVAVGIATGEALSEEGVADVLVAEKASSEGILETIASGFPAGKAVLLPRSALASSQLPDGLKTLGFDVLSVSLYQPVPDDEGIADLRKLLRDQAVDGVVFTSPSTLNSLVRNLDPDDMASLASLRLISIGPSTSAAIKAAGLKVAIEADPHTSEGLVSSVQKLFHLAK